MDHFPIRRTNRLHAGRVSAAGAVYFTTLTTRNREPWLSNPVAAEATLAVLRRWHHENAGTILAATILPDHLHVLVELGPEGSIGRAVARWKALAGRDAGWPGEWQRDFWGHRVLDDEDLEAFGWYVFLNPYRAKLAGWDEPWNWWWAPDPGRFRFSQALDPRGVPPAEWKAWPDDPFDGLQTGE